MAVNQAKSREKKRREETKERESREEDPTESIHTPTQHTRGKRGNTHTHRGKKHITQHSSSTSISTSSARQTLPTTSSHSHSIFESLSPISASSMSELWLAGDPSLESSALHLQLDQFLDSSLSAKRQLYLQNGSSWICKFFQKNQCARGQECPYRHSKGDKPTVCKYWLRGSCKKGADTCESLHIYDLSKMPMCQFIIDYGSCSNADCLFNHVKPEVEEVDCVWYARGFCRRGPLCKNRHRKREMCPDYLAGFCELGPHCEKGHPKWLLPEDTDTPQIQYDAQGNPLSAQDMTKRTLRTLVGMSLNVPREKKTVADVQCNSCKQFGHFAGACPNKPSDSSTGTGGPIGGGRVQRDLATVLCFRCGEHGHYASFCTNQKREPPPGGWPLPAGAKPHTQRQKRGRDQY